MNKQLGVFRLKNLCVLGGYILEFSCSRCPKKYTTKRRLNDHLLKIHDIVMRKTASYSCGNCPNEFKRCDTVLRHLREFHNSTKPKKCVYCNIFLEISAIYKIMSQSVMTYAIIGPVSSQLKFTTEQQATKNFFQSYRIKFQDQIDLFAIMEDYKKISKLLQKEKFLSMDQSNSNFQFLPIF